MGKFAEMVPERVRALASYIPGKRIQQAEAESGVRMVKLGSNENPFGPSPLAIRAMESAAGSVHLLVCYLEHLRRYVNSDYSRAASSK